MDEGELRERFDLDRLLQILNESRARHARFAVDSHCARTAYLFEAIRIVGDRCGRARPSAVTGLVAISIMAEMTFMPERYLELKLFPHRRCVGAGLALDFELNSLCHWSVSSLDHFVASVLSRTRLDVLNIYGLKLELGDGARSGKAGLGGLQKLLIVAIGEVGLVVCAARLVAQDRPVDNDPRKSERRCSAGARRRRMYWPIGSYRLG